MAPFKDAQQSHRSSSPILWSAWNAPAFSLQILLCSWLLLVLLSFHHHTWDSLISSPSLAHRLQKEMSLIFFQSSIQSRFTRFSEHFFGWLWVKNELVVTRELTAHYFATQSHTWGVWHLQYSSKYLLFLSVLASQSMKKKKKSLKISLKRDTKKKLSQCSV